MTGAILDSSSPCKQASQRAGTILLALTGALTNIMHGTRWMDRGPPASSSVRHGSHKNVTGGDGADNGETPVIGEITVITTFSSGEDENCEVKMIMKRIVSEPMVIREHVFRTSFICDNR